MDEHGWRTPLARYGAPIAFLAAATAAVLLVRAGLKAGNDKASTPAATITSTSPSGKRAFYRVRAGDSLSVVAERFDHAGRSGRAQPADRPNTLRRSVSASAFTRVLARGALQALLAAAASVLVLISSALAGPPRSG